MGCGVVFCLLFMSGCGRVSSDGQTLPESKLPASSSQAEVISTVTLVGHTESGRKKWEVQGDTADLSAQTVQLSPVAATSFGQRQIHLTAQHGQLNRETEDVHLEGDVVITTSDGMKMTTDSLDWDSKKETGTTPDWVSVSQLGMTAVGLGGKGYQKIHQARLERKVTVVLEGKEGATVITCDGPMDVDYQRRKARFWKNVRVRDVKGLIQSDRMDVGFSQGTNQLEKAVFLGHVQIHQENKVAFAHRANYRQSKGETALYGHTRLVMASPEEFSP